MKCCFYKEKIPANLSYKGIMKNPMDTHPSLEMHFSNSHDRPSNTVHFEDKVSTRLNRVLQHVSIKSSSRTQGRKWQKIWSNWATALKDPEWTTRGQSTRTSGSSWDIRFSHLSQMATTFKALKFKPTEKMPEQFPSPGSSGVKYGCYL